MHFNTYITNREAEISAEKQNGSTQLFHVITCLQSTDMTTETDIKTGQDEKRGQQLAGHARTLT